MPFVIGLNPYDLGAILDSNLNLVPVGSDTDFSYDGGFLLGGKRFRHLFSYYNGEETKTVFTDNGWRFSPVQPTGHGVIPLPSGRALGFGQDFIDDPSMSHTVNFAGLAIWQPQAAFYEGSYGTVYRQTGLIRFKTIQTPNNARVPEPDEVSLGASVENGGAFFSMGKYWFIDAIINHGGSLGKRRYLGIFDVESQTFTDCKDNAGLIAMINDKSRSIFRF
jgi:hypothetical protein